MTFPGFCSGLIGMVLLLHLYWALGGKRLLPVVVPIHRATRRPTFDVGRFSAGLVALALTHAAWTLGAAAELWQTPWSAHTNRYLVYLWTGIFVLRVVGDFRFIGLFKGVRGTPFARADDWLFTPVCGAVAIGFALTLVR